MPSSLAAEIDRLRSALTALSGGGGRRTTKKKTKRKAPSPRTKKAKRKAPRTKKKAPSPRTKKAKAPSPRTKKKAKSPKKRRRKAKPEPPPIVVDDSSTYARVQAFDEAAASVPPEPVVLSEKDAQNLEAGLELEAQLDVAQAQKDVASAVRELRKPARASPAASPAASQAGRVAELEAELARVRGVKDTVMSEFDADIKSAVPGSWLADSYGGETMDAIRARDASTPEARRREELARAQREMEMADGAEKEMLLATLANQLRGVPQADIPEDLRYPLAQQAQEKMERAQRVQAEMIVKMQRQLQQRPPENEAERASAISGIVSTIGGFVASDLANSARRHMLGLDPPGNNPLAGSMTGLMLGKAKDMLLGLGVSEDASKKAVEDITPKAGDIEKYVSMSYDSVLDKLNIRKEGKTAQEVHELLNNKLRGMKATDADIKTLEQIVGQPAGAIKGNFTNYVDARNATADALRKTALEGVAAKPEIRTEARPTWVRAEKKKGAAAKGSTPQTAGTAATGSTTAKKDAAADGSATATSVAKGAAQTAVTSAGTRVANNYFGDMIRDTASKYLGEGTVAGTLTSGLGAADLVDDIAYGLGASDVTRGGLKGLGGLAAAAVNYGNVGGLNQVTQAFGHGSLAGRVVEEATGSKTAAQTARWLTTAGSALAQGVDPYTLMKLGVGLGGLYGAARGAKYLWNNRGSIGKKFSNWKKWKETNAKNDIGFGGMAKSAWNTASSAARSAYNSLPSISSVASWFAKKRLGGGGTIKVPKGWAFLGVIQGVPIFRHVPTGSLQAMPPRGTRLLMGRTLDPSMRDFHRWSLGVRGGAPRRPLPNPVGARFTQVLSPTQLLDVEYGRTLHLDAAQVRHFRDSVLFDVLGPDKFDRFAASGSVAGCTADQRSVVRCLAGGQCVAGVPRGVGEAYAAAGRIVAAAAA